VAVALIFTGSACAENLTITTYYPSPYGSYRDLTTKKLKVGPNFSSSTNPQDGDVIIEGVLAIGYDDPALGRSSPWNAKMFVVGGGILAYNPTSNSYGMIVAGANGVTGVGFRTISTASEAWSADFDGKFKTAGSTYLATSSDTIAAVGTTSPTTPEGGRDIKFSASGYAAASDFYIRNSSKWVSAIHDDLIDGLNALTSSIAGKANTSHSHSVSCSCTKCNTGDWSTYGSSKACTGSKVVSGVRVRKESSGVDPEVSVICSDICCTCSVS